MNNDIMSKSVFPKHTYYHVNVCWEKMVGENGEEWSEPRHSYEFIDRCDLQMVAERLMDDGVVLELGDDEVMGIVDFFGAGVDGVRAIRKAQVLAWDKSSAVNEFTLNGYRMWLDRDERSGLRNRVNAELSAGVEMTTVWHGTRHVTVPTGFADARLRELEMYAAGVFDVTHRHLAELDGLKSIGELMAYDISEGYPEKLAMSTGDNGLND